MSTKPLEDRDLEGYTLFVYICSLLSNTFKWKPYLADNFCERCFFFQVKEKLLLKGIQVRSLYQRLSSPNQMAILLNKLLGPEGLLDLEKISLDLQGFEFQSMPKLTEVCFYRLDPSLVPQIQQVFHRKLPFVNTVFQEDGEEDNRDVVSDFLDDFFPDYDGIAVPDIEK